MYFLRFGKLKQSSDDKNLLMSIGDRLSVKSNSKSL